MRPPAFRAAHQIARGRGAVTSALLSLVLLSLVLVGSASLPSCGSPEGLCDRVCECIGCDEAQRDECYDGAEAEWARADEADCLGQYDDLLQCQHGELECLEGVVFFDACVEADDAYRSCLADAN